MGCMWCVLVASVAAVESESCEKWLRWLRGGCSAIYKIVQKLILYNKHEDRKDELLAFLTPSVQVSTLGIQCNDYRTLTPQ